MGEEREGKHEGDDRHVVHLEVRDVPPDPRIRVGERIRPRNRAPIYELEPRTSLR